MLLGGLRAWRIGDRVFFPVAFLRSRFVVSRIFIILGVTRIPFRS